MTTATNPDNTHPVFKFIYHILAYLTCAGLGVYLMYEAISAPAPILYAPSIGLFVSLVILVIDGAKGKWGLKAKFSDGKLKDVEVKAKFIIYSTWAMIALIAVWVGVVIGGVITQYA